MHTRSHENLINHLTPGSIYRRENLLPFSTSVDRDLNTLLTKGHLKKLSGGLYYKPKNSTLGPLPPDDNALVASFLRDDFFLLYSWNQYNSLGLGLTQLYNRMLVYNRKRHGVFKLGNKEFDFRRPTRGFPTKLSKEFLLVDLVNNLNELAEDSTSVKSQIIRQLHRFDRSQVLSYAKQYGKVATYRFFKELDH